MPETTVHGEIPDRVVDRETWTKLWFFLIYILFFSFLKIDSDVNRFHRGYDRGRNRRRERLGHAKRKERKRRKRGIEIASASVHAADPLGSPTISFERIIIGFAYTVGQGYEMAPLAVAVVHVRPRYLALTEK